jgi:predicted Zn-dependent protease
MEMYSLMALPYRATVKRCKNYTQETVNEFKEVDTDVHCKLIAETEGRGAGSFGRTLTGRYNIHFLTTANVKQNDHLVITLKGKSLGEFLLETCAHLETHTEGMLNNP